MALQTANQFQLTPNIGGAIAQGLNTGVNMASQFQQNQASRQNQQLVQQQEERRKQVEVVTDAANDAVAVSNLPDPASKISFLQNRSQEIIGRGGDDSDTKEVLALYESGQTEQADALINSLVKTAQDTGILKPADQVKELKPTASQQDFETFKQLNIRAQKTNDPIDIQLAEQFGRQSGFDRETPQELADIDVSKESKKSLVKQAATASKEAFDSLKGVRRTIANIDDAIRVLDVEGAETGPIISKLPSFRQAAIELDNIKGRMGLDVVGATTFGALSESELAFALNTALPDSLDGPALKDWLVRKKDSQTKLSNELRKAASFLGQPGNTIADYLELQEKENPSAVNSSDEDLKKRLGL